MACSPFIMWPVIVENRTFSDSISTMRPFSFSGRSHVSIGKFQARDSSPKISSNLLLVVSSGEKK